MEETKMHLGVDVGKTETVEQMKALIEANEAGLFRVGPRTNRRKTTRGRRTQVIVVPKYIVNPVLEDSQYADKVKILKEFIKNHPNDTPNIHAMFGGIPCFIPNPSKHAGKTKQIHHATIR